MLGERATGTGDMLLAGLRWAIQQNLDVINRSSSITRVRFVEELRALTDEAFFRRKAIVASARNSPVERVPWRFSSAISVGSHHQEDDPELYPYNLAPPVEFFAAGAERRGRLAGREDHPQHQQQLRHPVHRRALRAHPVQTSKDDRISTENGLYQSAANVHVGTGGAQ
jgi:hypothetical protein